MLNTRVVSADHSQAVTGIFRMDAVSGVLSTLQALDRDSGVTSYTITLKAEDKGSPVRSVTSSVTITITDVNDNDPVFTSSGYSKTLGESSATAGASLVVVSAGPCGELLRREFAHPTLIHVLWPAIEDEYTLSHYKQSTLHSLYLKENALVLFQN